jgi:hypothetical protein
MAEPRTSSAHPDQSGARGAQRVAAVWRRLDREQRYAAAAALGLFAAMFLPWYHRSFFNVRTARHGSDNLSALQAFSFIEGAILLIAVGTLLMLFARGERLAFHLPGGDGTVLMAAGLWVAFLLVWRLFDQPSPAVPQGAAVDVGLHWGIFFAFVAAGALIYAGNRERVAGRPEPPLHSRPAVPPHGAPVDVHIPNERPHLAETEVMPRGGEPAPAEPVVRDVDEPRAGEARTEPLVTRPQRSEPAPPDRPDGPDPSRADQPPLPGME